MNDRRRLSAGPVNPEKSARYSRFDQLNPRWWQRLEAAVDGAAADFPPNVALNRGELEIPWFNRRLVLIPVARKIFYRSGPGDEPAWQDGLVALALLDYLINHRQLPPPAGLVSEHHLPGGATFFRGPHVSAAVLVAEKYARDGAGMLARGREWGGTAAPFGEYAVRFTIFPGLDWIVALWEADDEFPARARYLFDTGLAQVFQLDLIWALGNIVAARLVSSRPTGLSGRRNE